MRALGVMAVAVTLVSVGASAAPVAQAASVATAPTCRSVALPVPKGTTESSVNGADPTGRLLVGVGFHQGGAEGLLWVNGRLRSINEHSLAPEVEVQFNAVNSRGETVGQRTTDDSSLHTDAFIYRNGRFTVLRAPSKGESTEALAIDSRGDVIGDAAGPSGWQAVEWPAGRPGTARVLAVPGGGSSFATGIDEDGTVVGYLGSFPPGTPYVWPAHGRPHALRVPAGSAGGEAVAIRDGWVAGNVFDPATGSTVPAVWNLHTGRFTLWRNVPGSALSINRFGTLGVAGGALVHANGRVVPVTGWVNAVTDRGTAAGATSEFAGHAVRWPDCR